MNPPAKEGQSLGMSYELVPKAKEIEDTFKELNSLSLLTTTPRFATLYNVMKTRMYEIKKEMKILKEKTSQEILSMKKEERMANLQNERDWFRREALELDKMCKDRKKAINKLKGKLDNAEDDRKWFQEKLMKVKKVNKTLVWELDRFKKALNVESSERLSPLRAEISNTEAQDEMVPQFKQFDQNVDAQSPERSLSPSPYYNQEENEIKAIMGPEPSIVKEVIENTENEDLKLVTLYEENSKESRNKFFPRSNPSIKSSQVSQAVLFSNEQIQEIIEENKKLKENELKYQDRINNLRDKLKQQKMKTIEANSNKVNYFSNRNDLEDFFLNCIEEVKKDIKKRREKQDGYQSKKLSRSNSEIVNKNRRIKGPKYENFTKTDKKKVIEMLISNEQVLLFLYEHLFPYEIQRPQSVKTLNLQKNRPTSSHPSLTTAQSFVPPHLLNNLAHGKRMMNEDATITEGHSPNKMSGRFLPNQQVRAKTAQGSARVKPGLSLRPVSEERLFKNKGSIHESNSIATASENPINPQSEYKYFGGLSNRINDQDYSYYSINKRLVGTPSDILGPVRPPQDDPSYSVQNNINNLNVNINMPPVDSQASHTRAFVPPKASSMKRLKQNQNLPRSISMKDFTRLKSSKSKRLKIYKK
ncbi:unnamed protein product [Moneuplotes crassus]|uniref:Uncharacterized protein n=2 Tax=Euplotes crassus TaxID=5936 RepID=A0AAD1U2S0_EUPCR|nr:unnamed protein product [Moneuplotes crassus]